MAFHILNTPQERHSGVKFDEHFGFSFLPVAA